MHILAQYHTINTPSDERSTPMKKIQKIVFCLVASLSSNLIFGAAAPRPFEKVDESITAPSIYQLNIIFHGHNFLTPADKKLLTDAVLQAINTRKIQVRSKNDNITSPSALEGPSNATQTAILQKHHLNRFDQISRRLTGELIHETMPHQFSCIAIPNASNQSINLEVYNCTTQTDIELNRSEGFIKYKISTEASEAIDGIFFFTSKLHRDSLLQDLHDKFNKFKIRVAYGPRTEKQQRTLQTTKKEAVSDFTHKTNEGRISEFLPTTLGVTYTTDTSDTYRSTVTVDTDCTFPSLRKLLQEEEYRAVLTRIIDTITRVQGISITSTLRIKFMCLVEPKLQYETLSKPFTVRLQRHGEAYQVIMDTEPDFSDKDVVITDAEDELQENLVLQPTPINGKSVQSSTQSIASSAAGAPTPSKEEPDDSWLSKPE